MATGTQAAAERRDQQAIKKFTTVRDLINKMSGQIAMALPKHMSAERMIRVALTAIQKTPALMDCDQKSLVGAIVQASQLGLEPDGVLGHAYLIPYRNNKNNNRLEAQLQIGYRGYIALARRSGEVSSISAEIVCKNDKFEVQYGTDRKLVHVPLLNQARGEKIGAYAVVQFKDGFTDFEYMDAIQIGQIRKASKAGDSGPWKTHEDEMWRKTPIRRLSKRLPLAVEDHDLIKAAVIDEYGDMGFGTNGDAIGLLPGGDDALPEPEPEKISEDQRTALVAYAKAKNVDTKTLSEIVKAAGFDLLADITVDKFIEVHDAITRKAEQPEDQAQENGETQGEGQGEGESEKPVIDKKENERLDLIAAINEKVTELSGGDAKKMVDLLDGRDLSKLSNMQLKDLNRELDNKLKG